MASEELNGALFSCTDLVTFLDLMLISVGFRFNMKMLTVSTLSLATSARNVVLMQFKDDIWVDLI